jgi:hypothetical protein
MDGPDLVLWQDERLVYPLSGDTIKGIRVSDGNLWWCCCHFWPVVVDIQCVLTKKKPKYFFPLCSSGCPFKKVKIWL